MNKMYGLLLSCWLLFLHIPSYHCQPTASLDANTVVAAIVESGLALNKAVNNFTNAEITPAINDLNQRIRAMNLEKAGIAQEKIPEYQKSLEDFSNIRKELLSMRIILKSLARETISRGESLLGTMDIAESEPDKAQKGLKFAAVLMMNLVKRSETILAEAEQYLQDVKKKLSTIDANLMTLKNKLEKNSSEVIAKMNMVSKRRRKRFAISTGLLIAAAVAGVSAAVGTGISLHKANQQRALMDKLIQDQQDQIKQLNEQYARAQRESQQRHDEMMKMLRDAEAKEAKMAEERKKMEYDMLKAQKVVINTAVSSVQFFITSLQDTNKYIANEQVLIKQWKSKLVQMIDVMKDSDGLVNMIGFDSAEVRTMIKNLQKACQNYIDGRIPSEGNV